MHWDITQDSALRNPYENYTMLDIIYIVHRHGFLPNPLPPPPTHTHTDYRMLSCTCLSTCTGCATDASFLSLLPHLYSLPWPGPACRSHLDLHLPRLRYSVPPRVCRVSDTWPVASCSVCPACIDNTPTPRTPPLPKKIKGAIEMIRPEWSVFQFVMVHGNFGLVFVILWRWDRSLPLFHVRPYIIKFWIMVKYRRINHPIPQNSDFW